MKLKKYQKDTLDRCICNVGGISYNQLTECSKFVDDLGFDSLDFVELIMEVEHNFEFEIPDEDAEKVKTVSDAYNLLARLL